MSGIYSTGTSALLAFQRALNTVGHNVANANTPGYSRQRVELQNMPGQATGYGFVGTGVKLGGVNRMVDQFVYARALDNAAELGRLGQLSAMSGRIDQLLSGDATGLAKPWSGFFDSMQGVAADPAALGPRQQMLSDMNALAERMRGLEQQFGAMHKEVNAKLDSGVADVNQMTGEIARLNEEIVRQFALSGGNPPNDLLDRREMLATQLSARLGVNTALQDDGAMNVFTPSGQALVVGVTSLKLATVADPFDPNRRELAIQGRGGTVRLGSQALGGELGGLVDFRRDMLDASSQQLGRLAAGLVEAANAQHRQGVDLAGQPGGDLFKPLVPRANAHSANTGTGSFQAAVTDASALDGREILLSFDGAAFTATDRASGQPLPLTGSGSAADPFVVKGVSLVLGGVPAAGDRFALQPTARLAAGMTASITDPAKFAAASPLRASADLSNVGLATPGVLRVGNPAAPGFGDPVDIEFIDADSYTIGGAGPFAYDPDTGIEGPGWTLRLEGTPVAGDRFNLQPRGPNSSDNGNMRLMAGLGSLAALDDGRTSLNAGVGLLTVSAGAQARQADYAFNAQSAIGEQINAQRDAVSGVNLDEEAANMMRYQQAYMAAAQLITTADQMFNSLLQAVRR